MKGFAFDLGISQHRALRTFREQAERQGTVKVLRRAILSGNKDRDKMNCEEDCPDPSTLSFTVRGRIWRDGWMGELCSVVSKYLYGGEG
jgi:hypothetical protein